MAAGLGFKDFVTGEVLTAADVDGYLMQGVWVFASAAARDAAVTSPQEGNFAYLKDTNVTTYYTGSAWANLDTTGMTNPMTTTGDTIYSSSGSTPARLGIGSTGNVLTVAGGVPTWAAPAGGSTFAGCRLTNAGFTTTSGTNANVAFSVETYDTNAYHDNVTNNSRATIPSGKAGYYYIQISGDWATNTSGTARYAFILLNGTTLATGTYFAQGAFANPEPSVTLSTVLYLSVADYVQMRVYQDRGNNLDFNNATMTLAYLGA